MTLLMKILTEILVEGSGLATGTSNDWGLPRGCFWVASVLGTGNAHIVFFSWLPGMFVPSCHPSRIISYQGQIIPPSKAVLTAWSWICSISGASPGHLFSANLRAPIGHCASGPTLSKKRARLSGPLLVSVLGSPPGCRITWATHTPADLLSLGGQRGLLTDQILILMALVPHPVPQLLFEKLADAFRWLAICP